MGLSMVYLKVRQIPDLTTTLATKVQCLRFLTIKP